MPGGRSTGRDAVVRRLAQWGARSAPAGTHRRKEPARTIGGNQMHKTVLLESHCAAIAPVLSRLLPCARIMLVALARSEPGGPSCSWSEGTTEQPSPAAAERAHETALGFLRQHPDRLDPSCLSLPDGSVLVLPLSAAADAPAAWVLSRSPGDFATEELDTAGLIAPGLRLRWRAGQQRAAGLTVRELDVLRLIAHGLTAGAVGRRCRISVRTVHKHLENAYRKLGCHDRLTATLMLREAGLLGDREYGQV